MRSRVALAAAAFLIGVANVGNTAPVQYDVIYEATLGPSGIGSFSFDDETGLITNFSWDFGGVTGGASDSNFTTFVFGDTYGRFTFEILSQTDVHPFVNCVGIGCGGALPIDIGSGPLGSTDFTFGFDPFTSEVVYDFQIPPGPLPVAMGTIHLERSISEPSALALLALGLAGLAFNRRKRAA